MSLGSDSYLKLKSHLGGYSRSSTYVDETSPVRVSGLGL
jgi:hypothetical protein